MSLPEFIASWPHGVGCEHCRKHELCNECGKPYRRNIVQGSTALVCTNGRCASCHASVCGQGAAHAPYRTVRAVAVEHTPRLSCGFPLDSGCNGYHAL